MTLEKKLRRMESDIKVHLPIYSFPLNHLLIWDLRRETRKYTPEVAGQLAKQIRKVVIPYHSLPVANMLMRTYKSSKFRDQINNLPENKRVQLVESVGSIAYNSRSGAATRTYLNLVLQDIEKGIDISRRANKIATIGNFRPVIRKLMKLVQEKDIDSAHEIVCKCEAFAYSVIGSGANTMLGDIYLSKEFKSLLDFPQATLEAMGERVQRVWNLKYIRRYFSLCYQLPNFEPHVYWELGRHYGMHDRERLSMVINKEKVFLNQQRSETVIPLIEMMCVLSEEYHPRIKSLDDNAKKYLTKAHSIARENKDENTGKNCLEEFYAGVKGMLDTRPDMLEEWAASICTEFHRQSEKNLLRVVQ